MRNEFPPADVPNAVNNGGPPAPPSGLHPVKNAPTVIVTTGPGRVPPTPPAAENVHGTPGSGAGFVTGVLDFTYLETPQPSRWDKGDGATAVGVLDTALGRAGLPGRLASP